MQCCVVLCWLGEVNGELDGYVAVPSTATIGNGRDSGYDQDEELEDIVRVTNALANNCVHTCCEVLCVLIMQPLSDDDARQPLMRNGRPRGYQSDHEPLTGWAVPSGTRDGMGVGSGDDIELRNMTSSRSLGGAYEALGDGDGVEGGVGSRYGHGAGGPPAVDMDEFSSK